MTKERISTQRTVPLRDRRSGRIAPALTVCDAWRGRVEAVIVQSESRAKRSVMMTLKVLGAASWVGAYREAILQSRELSEPLLPENAIAFNLAWEAIYTAGGIATWKKLTIEDKVQTVINATWLASDGIWTRNISRGGSRIKPAVAASAIAYQLAFALSLPPGRAARISALWQNLAFSAYCALRQGPTVSGFARRFTVLRAIGTAIPTMTSGVLRGIEPSYLIPGLGCVLFDGYRLYKITRTS